MTWGKWVPGWCRWLLAGLVMAIAAWVGWQVQGWRLGEQLAQQHAAHIAELAKRDQVHGSTLAEISRAGMQAQQREQAKRMELESQLQADDETNHRKLTDVQKANARLRDQLATTELRLSVVVDAADTAALASCGVPTTAPSGGVVDAAPRVRLDPAHAQRVLRIVDDGDQGLIALQACQDYVRRIGAKY
ncbi:hypothetical protein FQZ97_634630 [compost metagenome]